MTLINNCRGMALETVQRSEAPNDAWRNLESHYRAKETREILRLSHEVNGKTVEPGKDPFIFMMEIDRFAAHLHRLGKRSATELRGCVIIVAGLSADYEIEVRILENNPRGLERAEIEHVVINITGFSGNSRTQRFSRHRKAPPRWIVERTTGNLATDSRITASTAERRVATLRIAGAQRRRLPKSRDDAAADKKGRGRGKWLHLWE